MLKFFKIYYRLVGKKLPLLVLLMLLAAFFEGLSISMFLPILHQGGGVEENEITRVASAMFARLNIEYSLVPMLVFLVTFFILRSMFLIWNISYTGKIKSQLLVDLRCNNVSRLFSSDYRYFLSKSTGYLNNAIVTEFGRVAGSFSSFAAILVSIIQSLLYISLPLITNPRVTLIIVVVGIPVSLIVRKFNEITRAYSIENSKYSAKLQELLIQASNRFKYLKATWTHEKILKKIFRESKNLGNVSYKFAFWGGVSKHGFEPLIVLVIATLIFYQVKVLGEGIMQIFFILFLLNEAMKRLLGIQANHRKFLGTFGSIQVFRTLDKELEENPEPTVEKGGILNFAQPIQLKKVTFAYDDLPILQDVTMNIPSRSTVALVGTSGAGKSTLVNLITGLLRPQEGEVLLGQDDYKKINQEELRGNIGYITQENVIFNDTVTDNITLWEENPDQERVSEVCDKAHIKDFIEKQPQKFETILGDEGIKISGGQRQRICIARELYKDAQILIFDEATSSLDTESEREIQKSLQELKGKKTIIIIAHRLSTVKNADYIYVLKEGKVIEEGNYQELYQKGGEFKRMVDLQAL